MRIESRNWTHSDGTECHPYRPTSAAQANNQRRQGRKSCAENQDLRPLQCRWRGFGAIAFPQPAVAALCERR